MRAAGLPDDLAPFGFLDEEVAYRRSDEEVVLFRQCPVRGPGSGRLLITFDAPRIAAPFALLAMSGPDDALPLSVLRQEFTRGQAIELCEAHWEAVTESLVRAHQRPIDRSWQITPGRLAHRLGAWEEISPALRRAQVATQLRQERPGRLADLLAAG